MASPPPGGPLDLLAYVLAYPPLSVAKLRTSPRVPVFAPALSMSPHPLDDEAQLALDSLPPCSAMSSVLGAFVEGA